MKKKCPRIISNNIATDNLYKYFITKRKNLTPTMSQVYVILIEPGSLIENLHYGPFSRYWWEVPSISDSHTYPKFPIRVGQKSNACLNGREFHITIQISSSDQTLPEYYCRSGDFSVTETSATKAISKAYQNFFKNKTRYSGHIMVGWNNKKIIDILSYDIDFFPFSCQLGDYEIFIYSLGLSTRLDWNKAGNGYKSSIIHTYKKRLAIFVSEIENDECYVYIYQDFKLQKKFVGTNPNDVWKNSGYIQKFSGMQLFGLEDQVTKKKLYDFRVPQCCSNEWSNFDLMKTLYEYHLQRRTFINIKWYNLFVRWDQNEHNVIELSSELKLLYPPEHQFSDRERGAWLSILCAAGCTNITPWSHSESEV